MIFKFTFFYFALKESLFQALESLRVNSLRTILSISSVAVGIFVTTSILATVDALEEMIENSFSFLGTNVIYVNKWPFSVQTTEKDKWWRYIARPHPSYKEFKFLEHNLKSKTAIAIYASHSETKIEWGTSSIRNTTLRGGTFDYKDVFKFEIEKGRYFTHDEVHFARKVIIIGNGIVKSLFVNGENPLGKKIKLKGDKFTIIGTIEREGEEIVGLKSNDYFAIIPYQAYRKLYSTGMGFWNEKGSSIALKGLDYDIDQVELESETRGLLRRIRGLRPDRTDNFSIDKAQGLINIIEPVFSTMRIAGLIISSFSILIGGFSTANIMLVSIKEQISVIGLRKALGAKSYFIFYQFFFESVLLCFMGAFVGILLFFLLTKIRFGFLDLDFKLHNILVAVIVAGLMGIISGIAPALIASKLNPITALKNLDV